MQVDFLCPRWGSENVPWDLFLEKVKNAGYKGIEWFPYGKEEDLDMVVDMLNKYELTFSIVMTVVGNTLNFDAYLIQLEKQLRELCSIGKPLFISAQVGREYFTSTQIDRCLYCCRAISMENSIPIYQETHRNKWPFAVHVLPEVIKRNPEVLFTLDISHWYCVSESYLEDQQEAVDLVIEKTRHVHARVGHTQGSQVTDPMLPQYAEAFEMHLKVWDKWIENSQKRGCKVVTISPEFGPPPYLTKSPLITDPWKEQWLLNLRMKEFLNKRYNN